METQQTPTPAPRKSRLPYIIGGIIVLLLAGATFLGARLLMGQGLPGLSGGPSIQPHHPDILPARQLPQTPADVDGVFDHHHDNSIFVGTGEARIMSQTDQSGNIVGFTTSHTGPVVEVVVTSQTIIYKDVTSQQYNGQLPPDTRVQQVVEPGSLDEIGQNSAVTVWGRKTDDRYIADILVYTSPAFIKK